MQRRVALIILACGVAAFLVGLYGVLGRASPALGVVGLLAIVIGFGGLIFSLRGSVPRKPNIIIVVLVSLGVALHAYEQTLASGPVNVIWFLWSLVPYAVCMLASTLSSVRIPSIVAAAVVLCVDLSVHYDVFVNSTSSTAALALVFVPLWSALVFAPLAMLVTWLIIRCIRHLGEQ